MIEDGCRGRHGPRGHCRRASTTDTGRKQPFLGRYSLLSVGRANRIKLQLPADLCAHVLNVCRSGVRAATLVGPIGLFHSLRAVQERILIEIYTFIFYAVSRATGWGEGLTSTSR